MRNSSTERFFALCCCFFAFQGVCLNEERKNSQGAVNMASIIHSKSLLFYQSGIGVRAIRMTARIAPANAAAPMTATTFLLSFFFAALQISAAQATQTAAAIRAIPSVSHSHDSSYRILMYSPSPSVHRKTVTFTSCFISSFFHGFYLSLHNNCE